MALIMTLGILSMLLVLALAFASSARTERKAAGANANVVQARLLAESTCEKVIALLEYYDNVTHSHSDSDTHPEASLGGLHSPNVKNRGTYDWIHHLAITDYHGTEILPWYRNSVYDDINWEYVYANKTNPHATSSIDPGKDFDKLKNPVSIIGRYAFDVKTGGGVNPAALVKYGVDESAFNEDRLGVEVNEVNIFSFHDTSNLSQPPPQPWATWVTGVAGDIQNFSMKHDNGTLDNNTDWQSFSVMFDSSHINVTEANCGSSYRDKQEKIKQWFVEKPKRSKEGFWIDHNDNVGAGPINGSADGNKSAKPGAPNVMDLPYEFFHRFNLARMDWDDLANDSGGSGNSATDVDVIMSDGLNQAYDGKDYEYPWEWSENGNADGTADNKCDGNVIPWLANWQSAGTFDLNHNGIADPEDNKARGRQIAANLIDYCDGDDTPTSDVDPGSWDATHVPTYTGNEKTQYINEIYCEFEATYSQSDTGGIPVVKDTNNYTIQVDLFVETVDIYGGSPDVDVYIEGELKFKYKNTDSSITSQTVPISGNITSASDSTGGDFNQRADTIYNASFHSSRHEIASNPEISDVTLKITNVWIKAADNVDYAIPHPVEIETPKKVLTPDSGSSSTSGTCHVGFDIEVKDPRQNLNPGDWYTTVYTGADFNTTVHNTLGANNSDSDPNPPAPAPPPGDIERMHVVVDSTAAQPEDQYLSTAYIANRPIRSPWELGVIHRGAAWETINLKGYNMDAATTGGGGAYAKGDANILDQIKMTSDTISPMKISPRVEFPKDTMYALINQIKVGDSFDDIASATSAGTAITGVGCSRVASSIIGVTPNCFSRGCVAQASGLTDGSCGIIQDTDAKKEELIGKFINLTSVEKSDYFTIIVLAQSIKDVGGLGVDIIINKDLDGDGDVDGNVSEIWDIDGKNTTSNSNNDIRYNNYDDFANDTSISDANEDHDNNPETIPAQLGRYDQYADEIRAEQKIKVQVYRDPVTKKITVLSYEYIND